MWTKTKIRGRDAFTFNRLSSYKEYELGDIDLLNQYQGGGNSIFEDEECYYTRVGTAPLIQKLIPHEYSVLPEGIYRVESINHDLVFMPTVLNGREECLEFQIVKEMRNDFNHFMESREAYKKLSLLHKRGILLYGPPGTGKTTVISKLIRDIRPKDSLVLFIDAGISPETIFHLKRDPRLKIIVFEELTEACLYEEKRQLLLDFLDGESSLDNCFIIGTTNYPEKLPTNIINRPGRFDRFYKVDFLSTQDIKQYFKHFLKRDIDEEELNLFHKVTIAELKEMLLLIVRDNLTLKKAHSLIKEQSILVTKEFSSKGPVGFHSDEDDLEGIL